MKGNYDFIFQQIWILCCELCYDCEADLALAHKSKVRSDKWKHMIMEFLTVCALISTIIKIKWTSNVNLMDISLSWINLYHDF